MFVGTNSNRVIPPDNSLTMASVMAHGFERLFAKGRLGSMRKQKIHSTPTVFGNFLDSSSAASSSSDSTELALANEQSLFPAASFIRPATARMVARDEKSPSCRRLKETMGAKRSPRLSRRFSASESHSSGTSSVRSSVRSSIRSSTPRIPRRSSSLVAQHREEHPSLASLLHYEFTEGESKNAQRSLSHLCMPAPQFYSASLAQLEKSLNLDDIPPTPPPKDDHLIRSSQVASSPPYPRPLSPGVAYRQPLPAVTARPALRPSLSSRSVPDLVAQAANQQDPAEVGLRQQWPPRIVTESSQPATSLHHRSRSSDPVLQEPDVGDFLGLSDDDIAEERPITPPIALLARPADTEMTLGPEPKTVQQPITPPKSPSRSLRKSSLDSEPTSPPPTASLPTPLSVKRISARLSMGTSEDRAAAMAAFEVARIASRYNFDLIYIIDMWPKQMLRRKASSAQTCDPFSASGLASPARRSGSVRSSTHTRASSNRSSRLSEPQDYANSNGGSDRLSENNGLDYRFLAAYGLHTVKPPLDIAYGVHSKILKHDGWIEYRQSERNDNEFARGYACSFYTGCAPAVAYHSRTSSLASTSEASIVGDPVAMSPELEKSKSAMRLNSSTDRPEHNRGIVFAAYRKRQLDGETPGLNRDELNSMQLDAETLVNMIVDCHKVKRRSEQHVKADLRQRHPSGAVQLSADPIGTVNDGAQPRASI